MHGELAAAYPQLDIEILGINLAGLEGGNNGFTQGRDIPWLQDIDDDHNGESDVWEAWGITPRDVVILDADGDKVGVYNLTEHNLASSRNYATMRQMFLAAAVPEPSTAVLVCVGLFGLLCLRRGR